MYDLLDKVIKGFTCCDGAAVHLGHCQEDCPYLGESERADECVEKLHSDALALLKALEPIEPVIKQEMDDVCSCIDAVAYCGKCGAYIGRLKQNYCHECGKAVKWE